MSETGPRKRIVLPVSRIVIILILGAVFLVRGLLTVVEKAEGKILINNSFVALYFIIGTLMFIGGAIMLLLRLRSPKS